VRNFPAAERDAMYDLATAAVGPSEEGLRYARHQAEHEAQKALPENAPAEARTRCDRARLLIEAALERGLLAVSPDGKERIISQLRVALDAEVRAGGPFLSHDPEDMPRELARASGAERLGRDLASALVADETVMVDSFESDGRYLGPHVRAWLRHLLDLSAEEAPGK
jgi:hypothetical protein